MKKILQLKTYNLKPSKGFTLTEFIVYTGIFAFVILFLAQLLIALLSSNARGRAREAVITNGITAIAAIELEIKHAVAVYEPTSDFDTSSGQLSLVTDYDLPSGETLGYVDIYLSDDGRLCIKKEISGISCITSDEIDVVALDFNIINPTIGSRGAQTIITLEYRTPDLDNRAQFKIQSSATVRDYQ